MPILTRYKEHEMAKERMTAIKNIRYLFESDEVENDRVMFCGLKGLGFENFQKHQASSLLKPSVQLCYRKSMSVCKC